MNILQTKLSSPLATGMAYMIARWILGISFFIFGINFRFTAVYLPTQLLLQNFTVFFFGVKSFPQN